MKRLSVKPYNVIFRDKDGAISLLSIMASSRMSARRKMYQKYKDKSVEIIDVLEDRSKANA